MRYVAGRFRLVGNVIPAAVAVRGPDS